ncbi:MAG: hypothetical protein O9284_14225 [Steroidobacteraceae bacterium]|jgi:hypothetical protein|nr:hypothetical protein [Steroidobacteraceae bacterium]
MDESLNLERLGRLCRAAHAELVEWVELGVLEVHGREQGPAGWRFDAEAVPRVAAIARLARELDLAPHAAALVHDLLGERRRLECRVAMLERLLR